MIRELYREARTVYPAFHAKMSLFLVLSAAVVLVPLVWSLPNSSFLLGPVTMYQETEADYTVLTIFLIVVPIGLLTLSWYHLRLKNSPWMKKRRLRYE